MNTEVQTPTRECILLEVTSVRVERLQSISEEDAIAEGCNYRGGCECNPSARTAWCKIHGGPGFESLWRHINGCESWEANPWVWVVSFKRITEKSSQC